MTFNKQGYKTGMIRNLDFLENKNEIKFLDPSKKIVANVSEFLFRKCLIDKLKLLNRISRFFPLLYICKSEVNIIINKVKKSIVFFILESQNFCK